MNTGMSWEGYKPHRLGSAPGHWRTALATRLSLSHPSRALRSFPVQGCAVSASITSLAAFSQSRR